MTVYISFDFEDQAQFDNITDALQQAGISYWDPASVRPGALLADQLRDAICASNACIFIATSRSVASTWCNAELGAFWGADKPVIIYIADSSFRESMLPKQFQGHFLERRIAKVVETVNVQMREEATNAARNAAPRAPDPLQALSREDLKTLIEDAVARTQDRALTSSLMSQIVELIGDGDLQALGEEKRRRLKSILHSLLGIVRTIVNEVAPRWWHYQSSISTSTGTWSIYSLEQTYHAGGDVEVNRRSLLVRFDDKGRATAAAVAAQVTDMLGIGSGVAWSEPIALAGAGGLGPHPWKPK